jgi:hypothetical protein
MDRFLQIIESNTPEKDLDKLIKGKNELVSYLSKQDIKVTPKVFNDIIEIFANDKKYVLELVNVIPVQPEDDETSDVIGMTARIAQGTSENAPKARNVLKRFQNVEAPIIMKADRKVKEIERKAYENPINY